MSTASLNIKGKTGRMSKTIQNDSESFHEVQSVFFRNTHELTHKQVTKKFSKFGPIESIHQTGTAAGLCFVKFRSEESAQYCASVMRDDPTITLRAFNPESPNRAYKLQPGYWARRRIKQAEESRKRTNRVNSTEPRVLSSKKENEPKHQEDCHCSETTLESSEDIFERSIEYFETIQPMSREELIVNLSHVSKDLPEIVKKVKMISEDDMIEKYFYVLMKSRVEWEGLNGVDVEYVPAVAIVIGNIPMVCGVEFLLNLFEDYHPLVSSKIKTFMESLRYCYIYFEDSCDCEAVEQRYDNVEIFGNNLVVQSAKFLRKRLCT